MAAECRLAIFAGLFAIFAVQSSNREEREETAAKNEELYQS